MLTRLNAIAIGGVFRYYKKDWLGGFALNIGIGSVVEAELWGIFEGLKIAWKAGYKKIIMESDSKNVVMLLSSPLSLNHPLFHFIQDSILLMEKDWRCYMQHVYRECNRVANGMVCLNHSLGLDTVWFDNPSTPIVDHLIFLKTM
ncbi:hypothetical protein Ddye_003818 [Dipteronia dyeriana]|uniref:RNase H type-1 domain-containing protein n=1 Tax=Dipteronia dyeriana TaxID=168575 RepID=A0AAE0CVT8_9ROSI|nr:hypothetical protein Ddye_003818 [Dipteronia dyeriana]